MIREEPNFFYYDSSGENEYRDKAEQATSVENGVKEAERKVNVGMKNAAKTSSNNVQVTTNTK